MSNYLQKIIYLSESDYQVLAQGTNQNPQSITRNGYTLTNLNDDWIYMTDSNITNIDLQNTIIDVVHGGTGNSSLAAGQLLMGNGANAITTISKSSENVANNVVVRDANGNFSAGTITAALSGNASTATSATKLAHTAVDLTTINNTAGSFAFSITAKIPGMEYTGTPDWVGLQIGDSVDKWQLTAIGNTLYFRENDTGGTNTSWNSWVKLLNNENTASGANNNATLTWNTTYTLAKINGVDIKFTTMAQPTYDNNYLKLDGSNNMTADINIIAGDTDKFVNFWYSTNKTVGASWHLGMKGSGQSDTNYFVIESGTSNTATTDWIDTIRIGQNSYDIQIRGNLYPAVTNTKTLGTSNLKWSAVYATTLNGSLNWSNLTNIPTASSSTAGITTVGASGGAAAYSHTHNYLTSITWNSTDKKLQQSVNGGTATDILTFSAGSNISFDTTTTGQLQISNTYSYTHPITSGNKHIPSGGSSGQFLGWSADGTATWVNNPNTHYNADIYVTGNSGTSNVTSDTSDPYIALVENSNRRTAVQIYAGSNMSISGNNGIITFNATDTTYSTFIKSGSTAAAGLVPAPPTTAGTAKFLCEDGTWTAPPQGVTSVASGAGLTGGTITGTGTIKANLTSETQLTNAAADGTETSGRVYPVRLDKNGKLAVNVPWTNVNSNYQTTLAFDGDYNASSNKVATVSTVTTAINALDGNITGSGSATKTITALSQTNGKVTATFSNITFPVTAVAGQTGDIQASDLREALGLSSAMHYRGTSSAIPPASGTYASGDVLVKTGTDEEYVYDGTSWRLLGSESSYKPKQDAVSSPTENGSTTAFIDTISQDPNGKITATKKSIPTADSTTIGITKVGASGGAAAYDHTHTLSIAEDNGTNALTLAYGTKYKLTAGDSTYIFTMPDSDNTDTHRIVKVDDTQILANNTTALNLKAGSNITISATANSGDITISAADPTVTQNIFATSNTNNYPLLASVYTTSQSTTTASTVNRLTTVYITPSTGMLSANVFSLNLSGTEKVQLQWNDNDHSLDFIFA